MTEEEFEKEANKWADDMVWALVDMKREANDDERDFLVQEYKDLQERFTKEVQVKIDNRLKRHCNTIHSLVDELERRQNVEKELQEENKDIQQSCENYYNEMRSYKNKVTDLEKENAELKEGLTVDSMWNKHLNSKNKALEEERDNYRNITFDLREQFTKAKKYIRELARAVEHSYSVLNWQRPPIKTEAEQFLKEVEK